MTFRAAQRAVALGFALGICVVRYGWRRVRGPLTLEERALWMQDAGRRVLTGLGIRYRVVGTVPTRGVVVANHLSYLDIVILSAAMPCFFVAKAEIGGWPFFGATARMGGAIFIDRGSLASAEKVTSLISRRLELPVPVLFFPEGTSTDGSSVQRFHSRLFEPAVRAGVPVTAAALRYVPGNGEQERSLCWFGDDPFLPHLLRTLGAEDFTAEVKFGEPHVYGERRAAARSTRAEVTALRQGELVVQ
ncbi:MAG TPA: lysophospholipid acyltransferase family protein [Terracidiphilus sp.]|nr:lysophospholipid acyltransferase family protein [Terracidiphilus sp.]